MGKQTTVIPVSNDLTLTIEQNQPPEYNRYILKSEITAVFAELGTVIILPDELVDLILKLRQCEDIETRKAFS